MVYSLDADVTLHCDNEGVLALSTDGGLSFTDVASETNWPTPLSYTVSDATSNTILKLTCKDLHVVGGFIATVNYDSDTYSTTNPIDDGNWNLISSDDGITEPLVYNEKTSPPWNIDTPGIADDAYWIWTENIYNTIVFEFDFSNIIADPTQNPSEDPTRSPSQDPTRSPTKDPSESPTACFNNIREWVIDDIGKSSQFR